MTGVVSLHGVRALVVEDSWQVATAVTRLAENTGMVVVGPAATVAEAEQLLLALTPDVAIIDINLRGEMAYGLIDQLHEKGVPIVVMTGYDAFPHVKDKVAAILTKPFRAASLFNHLRRIMAARPTG